jgi:hypothetical protein
LTIKLPIFHLTPTINEPLQQFLNVVVINEIALEDAVIVFNKIPLLVPLAAFGCLFWLLAICSSSSCFLYLLRCSFGFVLSSELDNALDDSGNTSNKQMILSSNRRRGIEAMPRTMDPARRGRQDLLYPRERRDRSRLKRQDLVG